jgi:pimeloyl-ACP methyl ester carboxylesterase
MNAHQVGAAEKEMLILKGKYSKTHGFPKEKAKMTRKSLFLGVGLFLTLAMSALAEDPWLVLPDTPTLPMAAKSGYAPVNNVKIWYAEFGEGSPVVLLHGGLGNSNYWGNQVRALSSRYRVIVLDSRGHGRSTRDERPLGYALLASDVLAVLDFLKIQKAAIVGWSDGAILGLDIAINHPDRITKLFAFAANSNPSGVADIAASKVFNAYITRAENEYEKLSPTPTEYKSFVDQMRKMWETEPNYTKEQLNGIRTPTWIVDGDRDEAIRREHTEYLAAQIPGAGLLLLPRVSHFAHIQDPAQFNEALLHFLSYLLDAK